MGRYSRKPPRSLLRIDFRRPQATGSRSFGFRPRDGGSGTSDSDGIRDMALATPVTVPPESRPPKLFRQGDTLFENFDGLHISKI